MPKRKRTFKRPSRKIARFKRRRRYRRYRRIPRGPSGVPVNKPVRMRYCKEGYLASTGGAFNHFVMSMNDIFDPEFAVGGHQPMGFDQMAAMYNRYLVLGSKITVSFYDNASTHNTPVLVGACMSDAATPPYTTTTGYIEAKRGQWRTITGGQRYATKLQCRYSPKRFWGLKDIKDNREKIGSGVTASPEQIAHCIVWIKATDGGTQSLSVTTVIDFLVQFSEAKDLVQS